MVCFLSQIAVNGDMRACFEEIVDVLVHRHTSLLCNGKWEIGIVRMNLHSKRLSTLQRLVQSVRNQRGRAFYHRVLSPLVPFSPNTVT